MQKAEKRSNQLRITFSSSNGSLEFAEAEFFDERENEDRTNENVPNANDLNGIDERYATHAIRLYEVKKLSIFSFYSPTKKYTLVQ